MLNARSRADSRCWERSRAGGSGGGGWGWHLVPGRRSAAPHRHPPRVAPAERLRTGAVGPELASPRQERSVWGGKPELCTGDFV